MDKNKTYGVVAAVIVIIIIIAVAAWYMTSNDDNGSDTPTDEGDTYYFYLDGFSDEIDGWYDANGTNAEVAFTAAMDEAGIACDVSGGWISAIGDYMPGIDDKYFGTYVYTANSVEAPSAFYFGTGPVLSEMNGNIVYISYTTYTMDENESMTYDLSPTTTESGFMESGPFASDSYEPLTYDDTYWFYIDGMEDLDGWYTADGTDAEVALKAALDEVGVSYNISGGWMSSIGDYVAGADNLYFGTYIYTSNSLEVPSEYYFVTGSVLNEMAGNIVYIAYTTYTMDENESMTYDLNPITTESDMMTTGPFATA